MTTLLREDLGSISELTLDDLIYPLRIETFLTEHWGKSLLIVRRHSPDFFGKLFSLADLDACLMTAANSSGNVLHVIGSAGSGRDITLTPVQAISKESLYRSFHAGDTIRLIGVEKFWPPVNRLMATIQDALDISAGVNFFLTPPHSQAFPLHFDNTDAFIVQLAGSKRWQLWKPTYQLPLDSKLSERHVSVRMERDEAKLTPEEDFVLEAGDVLYMPRGFYHKALALDELSLHLTISLHPVSWWDFFKRAFELAAFEDVELRDNLPPRFVADARVQQSLREKFAHLLHRFSEKASFEKTLQSVVEDELKARKFPPDGHFEVMSKESEIGADTWVEKRKGLVCRVEELHDKAVIRFATQCVQGPGILLPALEYVRDQRRFRVRDLPGAASLEGKVTLVRRLAREGLLRLADSWRQSFIPTGGRRSGPQR